MTDIEAKELKNSQIELSYMENEYMKFIKRLEEVSDPSFFDNLKERIICLDEKIKKLKKGKKILEIDQLQREKRMDKVIEIGESDILAEIKKLKNDLTVICHKTLEVDKRLYKNNENIKELETKKQEFKKTLKKLGVESKAHGIDMSKKGSSNEILNKCKLLEQQKKSLYKATILIRTRHNVSVSDFNKESNKLNSQIANMSEKIQKKNEYDISSP